VTERHRYHLTNDIKADYTYTNGKLTKKELTYTGKKLRGYELSVLYKFDTSILSKTNPFWGDYEHFEVDIPEDPTKININDLMLCQSASHSFYTLDTEVVPVVYTADYFQNGHLSNKYYEIKDLRNHLLKHPNVITVSKVERIPYYSEEYDEYQDEYITCLILPDKKWLHKIENLKRGYDYSKITGQPWDNPHDFLNIQQFCKRTFF